MIDWPAVSDYNEALQHPQRVFKAVTLQACRAELNKLGVPKPRSGQFANVYKMINGHKVIAVKLFKYPEKEREERFKALNEHLDRSRPGCMVRFTYDPQGIRIRKDWYPVQTMEWVEGECLRLWVEGRVRQADAARL